MPQEQAAERRDETSLVGSWWSYSPYGPVDAVFHVQSWSRHGSGEGNMEIVPFHAARSHELHWTSVQEKFKGVAHELEALTLERFWELVERGIIQRIGSPKES